jgi:hypothetical protein
MLGQYAMQQTINKENADKDQYRRLMIAARAQLLHAAY